MYVQPLYIIIHDLIIIFELASTSSIRHLASSGPSKHRTDPSRQLHAGVLQSGYALQKRLCKMER